MRVGVTSENKLKVEAVRKAYSLIGLDIDIIGYSSNSGVGEQPVNEQTLTGARNRIFDLNNRFRLDRIVSIESGIFREGDKWLDRAVVVIYDPSTSDEIIGYSEGMVFPDEYVEKAREIGFDRVTVGQVMEEAGYIRNRKDPHLDISGVSRQVYLEQTIQKLVKEFENL